MISFKDLIKIIFLTIFFSIVIFFINYAFFTDVEKQIIEEEYIEPTVKKEIKKSEITNIVEKKQGFNSASKFYFVFIPSSFRENILNIVSPIKYSLENKIFSDRLSKLLKLEFYKEKLDVRGKMKSRSIKLFGPELMGKKETFAVFIHELGHFVDLYFLERKVSLDLSNKFYSIAWDSTKTKKAGLKSKDFVSGYAMTNKYEDFAESFTYYILHNKHFLEKTRNSAILKQKYDFFANYLFKQKEFFKSDFSVEAKAKNYYWDITKIDFNLNNFLQYLKK